MAQGFAKFHRFFALFGAVAAKITVIGGISGMRSIEFEAINSAGPMPHTNHLACISNASYNPAPSKKSDWTELPEPVLRKTNITRDET